MAKYLKRLSAKLAAQKLAESTKDGRNWIVSKKLILETEEGEVSFEKGETLDAGATEDGDLGINAGAAVVVISDADLAAKIADVIVSADELSDVKFVQKPALDAVLDGEEVEDVIDDLADGEDADDMTVEVPEVDVEQKESVEAKFEKISAHRISGKKALVCESIRIDDEDETPINLRLVKADRVVKESFGDYAEFTARVAELKGSIQPGKREIALTESGKVMGSFDKELGEGTLFCEEEFDSVEDMDSFDAEPENLMQDVDFGDEKIGVGETSTELAPETMEKFKAALAPYIENGVENLALADLQATMDKLEAEDPQTADEVTTYGVFKVLRQMAHEDCAPECLDATADVVESVLKKFEESAQTGKDYMKMVNSLQGLSEATIAKIVSTFDSRSLKECVKVFDTKLGKYCKVCKESVEADNFIAEANTAKRFTKRFFA